MPVIVGVLSRLLIPAIVGFFGVDAEQEYLGELTRGLFYSDLLFLL